MLWPVQAPLASVSAIARVTLLTIACEGLDLSGAVDDAQSVSGAFEDIQVSAAVERDGARVDQRCFDRVVSVGGHAFLAISGDGGHDARFQINLPDAAIIEVSQSKDLAGLIERQAIDGAEFCCCGRPTVSGKPLSSRAGEIRDRAGAGVDLANPVVPRISNEDVAVRCNGEAMRSVQLGVGSGALITAVSLAPDPASVVT